MGDSSSNRYGMNLHELRDLKKSRWRLGVDSEMRAQSLVMGSVSSEVIRTSTKPVLVVE